MGCYGLKVLCLVVLVLILITKKMSLNERTQKGKIEVKWESTKENEIFRAFLDSSELEDGLDSTQAYEVLNDTSILPPSARIVARKIFHKKPLVIWATEWHMTPIKDLKLLLAPFGVQVYDYNLDPGRCNYHDCNSRAPLKVLKPKNVLDLTSSVEEKYIQVYKNDTTMTSVDVVYCAYPASLCQIYQRLNKSVIIHATTRYDVGRYNIERLNKLNEDYRQLAKIPWNIISGNSLYDAQFIRYYSGINAHHLPSVCDYTKAEYNATNSTYLWLRRRDNGFTPIFLESFKNYCQEINCSVQMKRLPKYSFQSLASYKGIVHVPYQVSVMSVFEQYRMNIPMFVPSVNLMADWQFRFYNMQERSFEGAFFGKRPNQSIISPHSSQKNVPDPKNELDFKSILYWFKFSDFYQVFPHLVIYQSIPNLVNILNTISDEKLNQISSKIRAYNIQFKKKILKKWKGILLRIARNSPNHPH